MRSTLNPGTCSQLLALLEDVDDLCNGKNFQLVYNPEFLREGSALDDWFNPPFTVYGRSTNSHDSILAKLASYSNASVKYTDLSVSELLKPVCNSFHALKVAFANEIGCFLKLLMLIPLI